VEQQREQQLFSLTLGKSLNFVGNIHARVSEPPPPPPTQRELREIEACRLAVRRRKCAEANHWGLTMKADKYGRMICQ